MNLKTCRICKKNLKLIIDLGKICLVGDFKNNKKKQKKYSISLNYCKSCKHVQISEHIRPDLLFKNYLWETGVSKSNISIIKNYFTILRKYKINRQSKLLEVASNDGSFVKKINNFFKCTVIGVDPAKNFKKKYPKNIKFINNYFDEHSSKKIGKKFGKFDFIIARNVVAHVSNPNKIFSGFNKLLKKDGVGIIEVPHLYNIIKENQYDNIFHEHIGFHSLKSLKDLCEMNKLKIFNVQKINSQGGSLRCFIVKKKSAYKTSKNINIILSKEMKLGLFKENNLKKFKTIINKHRRVFMNLLQKIKNKNKKISIYGASGKGQALMQYCGIDNKIIDHVYDKGKLKIGKYTPGTNIKILNPDKINVKNVNYLLILTWNLKREIILQEKFFKKAGGKFIVPFPKPKIISNIK
jgi:SAM-dependent methyltransferase